MDRDFTNCATSLLILCGSLAALFFGIHLVNTPRATCNGHMMSSMDTCVTYDIHHPHRAKARSPVEQRDREHDTGWLVVSVGSATGVVSVLCLAFALYTPRPKAAARTRTAFHPAAVRVGQRHTRAGSRQQERLRGRAALANSRGWHHNARDDSALEGFDARTFSAPEEHLAISVIFGRRNSREFTVFDRIRRDAPFLELADTCYVVPLPVSLSYFRVLQTTRRLTRVTRAGQPPLRRSPAPFGVGYLAGGDDEQATAPFLTPQVARLVRSLETPLRRLDTTVCFDGARLVCTHRVGAHACTIEHNAGVLTALATVLTATADTRGLRREHATHPFPPRV